MMIFRKDYFRFASICLYSIFLVSFLTNFVLLTLKYNQKCQTVYKGQPGLRTSTEDGDLLPTIYVVTPTYARDAQLADLVALQNTLLHVRNILWIVIEDSEIKTEKIGYFLDLSNFPFAHLNIATPAFNSSGIKDNRVRGVLQRNIAIEWLKRNRQTLNKGVVYFADDDNRYDLRLFHEMRWTKKVSVWPVAFSARMYYERPICKNGKVIGFFTWVKRKFAIDMAGFAVNLDFMLSFKDVKFLPIKGMLETNFLKKMVKLQDLEARADNCTKIYVWHTKTKVYTLESEKLKKAYNLTYDENILHSV